MCHRCFFGQTTRPTTIRQLISPRIWFLPTLSQLVGPVFIGGIFNVTPCGISRSAIVNPLSAMTESPHSRDSELTIRNVATPYSLDTKLIAPDDVIPMSAFNALWFLYEQNVSCYASGLKSCSI